MTAYGPGLNITNAPSEDSDQPAQPYSVGREGSKAWSGAQRRFRSVLAGHTCNLVGDAVPGSNVRDLKQPCYITKACLFKYTENFTPKNENFQIKNSNIFHIFAQNIDCGYSLEPPRRGGSNEYPQSMFLSRNKKNNVYPYKPQFYYIKVGFKGVKIIKVCFRDEHST